MADHPLRPATRRSLGEPLPHQQADRTRAHLKAEAEATIWSARLRETTSSGISPGFPELSQSLRQVAHVLLTRSPLSGDPKVPFALDLHVLGTPPAFVLSQDQTLHEVFRNEPKPGSDFWKSLN